MRAKVLAPAATQTEFGKKADNVGSYDYDKTFGIYHTYGSNEKERLIKRKICSNYSSSKIVSFISGKSNSSDMVMSKPIASL